MARHDKVVFLYMFMDRDGVEVDKHAKKKRMRPISSHLTPKTWSIEDALYRIKNKFFLRETARKEISAQELILAS